MAETELPRDKAAERTIVLGKDWLAGSDAAGLVQRVFGENTLTINKAVKQTENGTTDVVGVVSLLGIEALSVRVISRDHGVPSFTLTATLPEGWKIADSFIRLPATPTIGSEAQWTDESVLHLLSFSDVQVVLSSDAFDDEELGLHLARGLNIIAQLELPAALKGLGLFDATSERKRLAGVLHDGSEDPLIDIRVPVPFNLDLGPLKLKDTAVRFYSSLSQWQYAPRSGTEFFGTINVGNSQCRLAADIRLDEDNPLFTLWGRFTDVKMSGLKDLAQFLCAGDLFDAVPPSLRQAIRSIELQQITTVFSTIPFSLNYLGFSVKSDAKWQPIGKGLDIQGIGLDGLVAYPTDSKRRNVSFDLRGEVRIGQGVIEIGADLSAPKLYGALREGDNLQISVLTKQLLPMLADIPALDINHLVFEADTEGGNYSLEMAVDGTWPVPIPGLEMEIEEPVVSIKRSSSGAASTAVKLSGVIGLQTAKIAITAELGKTFSLEGRSAAITLADITQSFFKYFPKNFPDLAIKEAATKLSADGVIEFNCRCDEVPLHDLAQKIGVPLPDGVAADIKLSALYLRANLSRGDDAVFKVKSEFPKALSFPENSEDHIDLHSVELNWSSKAGFGGQLDLGGTISPAAGVQVTIPRFSLGYNAEQGWFGAVNVTASIYGNQFTDFVAGMNDGKFSLSCNVKRSVGKLLDVPNIVAVQIERFSLFVDKADGAESDSKWQFNVDGAGCIKLGPRSKPYLETDFSIDVARHELQLHAVNPAPISVELSSIAPKPTLELRFSNISVRYDKPTSRFFVAGAGTGTLNNLPEMVRGRFFPEHLPAVELKASQEGLEVTCDLSKNPLSPDVQIFHIGGKPVGPKIEINELSIEFGDSPKIGSKLRVSELGILNYLFGKKDNGDPKVRFLSNTCDVLLSLGKKPIFQLQLESSPFEKFNFQNDADGKRFFIADLGGGLNQFKVYVPELGYSDKGGWSGAAGMEVLDPPIKIPLVPLKYVLRQLGAPPKVINAIPKSVPIDVVDINKHKTFRSVLEAALNSKAKVDKLYQSHIAGPTLNEFDTVVWQTIRNGVEQMPNAFRDYASPPDIKKLDINIAAAPGGAWSGGLAAGNREPLRFMLPFVGGPVPELIGFSLKSFELGQATAGVATFKIDGAIDRFDLVTLVAAVLNRETKLLSKEQVGSLTNHLALANVFGVAFSGFPVPIPILYDKISWDYKNWWGLEGRSDWTFQLGKDTDIWAVLGALMPFFSQKGYHLADPKKRSGDQLRLILRVGPNYLQLPKYLGNNVIGSTKGTPSLPADVSVRWWLDACKFLNPGYAIRSVPLKDPSTGRPIRMGYKTVTFGPLMINAGWCITTEEEFKEEIIGDEQAEEILRAIDVSKTLEHLPRSKAGVAYDKGFIIVLAGSAKLAGILEYTAQFGIAVTSTGGFESRIFMEGGIASVVTLSMNGEIQVTRQGVTKIDGTCDLKVGGRSMIKIRGLIEVTDHSFMVGCTLTLASALDFGGVLYVGNDGVYIEGGFAWHYTAGQEISEAKICATFDGNGMLITLRDKKIFGSNSSVGVYVNQKGVPGALISFDLTGLNDLFIKEIGKNLDEVEKIVEQEKSGFEQLVKNNIRKVQNFDQLRTGLPGFLDGIKAQTVSVVKSRANKAWDDLSGIKKAGARALGYSKTVVGNESVKQALSFIKPMDTLKKQLIAIESKKIKDDAQRVHQTRTAIYKALIDSINLNGRKVPIKFWQITVKNITVRFQTKQLVDLRNLVNELPEDWSRAEAERDRIANSFASRASLALTDITKSVTEGLKDQVPRIEAIELDTALSGLKKPEVQVDVTMKQGRVTKKYKVDVDLTNLANSIPAITKSFVKMIA